MGLARVDGSEWPVQKWYDGLEAGDRRLQEELHLSGIVLDLLYNRSACFFQGTCLGGSWFLIRDQNIETGIGRNAGGKDGL